LDFVFKIGTVECKARDSGDLELIGRRVSRDERIVIGAVRPSLSIF